MNHSDAAADAAAWATLWAQSRQGAIDLEAPDPVSSALRALWAEQIPWLAGCERAADVGSGPAVLPLALRRIAAGPLDALEWECVDAAALPALALPPQLHLRAATDFAESQPQRGSVDALLSNFGLEYIDRTRVAQACARWLAPGGRLFAVVHHCDSLIDRTTRQSLADLQVALERWQLVARTGRVLEAMATLPADPALRRHHAPGLREAFNEAVDDLKQRMVERGERSAVWIDLLTALADLVRQAAAGEPEPARRRLAALDTGYAAETRRLQAMQAAALSVTDKGPFAAALQAAGLQTVDWRPVTCSAGAVALVLTAHRPR